MEEKGETPQKVRGKSSESINAAKKKKEKREKDGWEGGSRTGQEGAWPVFHCGAGVLRRVQLFVTPWTVTCQSSLSMGFPRQEYWSGLPCPPPGDLPDPGIEPASLVFPALQANSLPLSHLGEGNGNLLRYSCLENPMDGRAWWAAVHGVTKSWTQLSIFTFTFHFSLSCVGEGNGNPLQCSCLENPRDGGGWWVADCGVVQSRTPAAEPLGKAIHWGGVNPSLCVEQVIPFKYFTSFIPTLVSLLTYSELQIHSRSLPPVLAML